jgi:hypothetical protein
LVMALQGPPQVQTVALRALLKTDSFESVIMNN